MSYNEKTFEEKIKEIKLRKKIPIVLIAIIAIFFMICGIIAIFPKNNEYIDFNKKGDNISNRNARVDIYYLMGPVIQAKNKNKQEVEHFYIAFGEDDELYVISAKNIENIPVWGEEVNSDEDLNNLEKIEIKGERKFMEPALRSMLIRELNDSFGEEMATDEKLSQVLGNYYLDITPSDNTFGKNVFMLAGAFVIILVVYLFKALKGINELNTSIEELKKSGKFKDIEKDYENGQLIQYKKMNVDISTKYLFYYANGLTIIEFKNIKEVSAEKKLDQNLKRYKYIVIETKNGEKYYIAPQTGKKKKIIFEELLAKIKTKVN